MTTRKSYARQSGIGSPSATLIRSTPMPRPSSTSPYTPIGFGRRCSNASARTELPMCLPPDRVRLGLELRHAHQRAGGRRAGAGRVRRDRLLVGEDAAGIRLLLTGQQRGEVLAPVGRAVVGERLLGIVLVDAAVPVGLDDV